MANDDSRPIIQEAPKYSPALMKALDVLYHATSIAYGEAYRQQIETEKTVLRLEAELKAAKAQLEAQSRLTRHYNERTFQLDQDYIVRHGIDLAQYEDYMPGDELDDAVLPTADVVTLRVQKSVSSEPKAADNPLVELQILLCGTTFGDKSKVAA